MSIDATDLPSTGCASSSFAAQLDSTWPSTTDRRRVRVAIGMLYDFLGWENLESEQREKLDEVAEELIAALG